MRFLTFVIKNLLRRPGRSSLTVLGISLAVAAAISLIGVSQGFEQSYFELYTGYGVDLVVQRSGRAQQIASGLNQELGDRIRRLPGVNEVIYGLVDIVSFEEADLFVVLVNGWERDCPTIDHFQFIAGRKFRPGDQESVLLGKTLADSLGKHVGDEIDLYGRKLKVIGVYESRNVYENSFVIMPLDVLQKLTDRPGQVTGFTIEADPGSTPEEIDELRRRIEALEPRLAVLPTAEFVGSIAHIRAAQAMAWLTSTVAMILGGIGVLNTMIMSVSERTRELGVLRAIGWPRSRVVRMILAESIFISLAGAVVGIGGGMLLTEILGRIRATAGFISGHIAPDIIAEGIALALAMGLIGAAYPAYWSAGLRPVDALRHK
jgi:putative ABC transport system permease protein